MKRLVTVFFGLMLIAAFAQAAGFSAGTAEGIVTHGEITSRSPLSITQNVDTSYLTVESVACGGAGTTQNWYLRRFVLSDFGIVNQFSVEDVDYGVSSCTIGNAYAVDFVLFSIPTGAPFLFANMTEIARVTTGLFADTNTTGPYFMNQAITGTVMTGDDLVVAIDAPDGQVIGIDWRPGANDAGWIFDQSYLAAEACGVTEPIRVGDVGFENTQLVLVVNGDADGTTAAEDATFSSVKSLY